MGTLKPGELSKDKVAWHPPLGNSPLVIQDKSDTVRLKEHPEYRSFFLIKDKTPRKTIEMALRKHGKDPTVLDLDPEQPLRTRLVAVASPTTCGHESDQRGCQSRAPSHLRACRPGGPRSPAHVKELGATERCAPDRAELRRGRRCRCGEVLHT